MQGTLIYTSSISHITIVEINKLQIIPNTNIIVLKVGNSFQGVFWTKYRKDENVNTNKLENNIPPYLTSTTDYTHI